MRPEAVAPGVLRLAEPGVNAYYLERERILVDAGLPFFAGELVQAVAHLPVEAVVLTHGDLDHVGALSLLLRQRPLLVAAHAAEAPYLAEPQRRPGHRGLLAFLQPRLEVDRLLQEGDLLGAFAVVATPGHSPGHLSLFRAEDGVLLAGDACSVRGGRVRPSPAAPADHRLARRSLLALALLPVTLVLPGHGTPLPVGPADFVWAAR
jgi:glyoxylase-like metal-dependent hydrolase (beta-lactamase superfamily II)